MRFLVRVAIPVETGNDLARSGEMGKLIKQILEEQKPEAAYFTDVDGGRGGYIIVNLDKASDIPKIAEPWFLAFEADVEIHPVMLPEDLAAAGPHIESAVTKYA